MATIAELKAKLSADVTGFAAGMLQAEGSLAGFMSKSALAGGALTLIGLGALAIGKHALDMGTQFDSALDDIQTRTGKTGTELEKLGDSTREVFRSIPTDLGLAAEAIGLVNQRLGLMGAPLEEVSKQMLELSRITGTDLRTNIDSVSDAMIKWNVPAAEIPEHIDMLFRASQKSGAPLAKLADLVTQNAAALQGLGFNLPEAISLMALFEEAGINTGTASMGLKNALTKMVNDGIAPTKENFQKLVDNIKNAPTDFEALGLAVELFGSRAGPELADAIRDGRFDLDEMLGVVRDGKPTILETAEATNDFAEKWQILKNNLNDALIPLGTVLFDALNKSLPALILMVAGIVALVDAFAKLPGPIRDGIMLALAPAMGILQGAPAIIDAAKGAVDRIKGAFDSFGATLDATLSKTIQFVSDISGSFLLLYSAVTTSVSSLETSVKEEFVSLWLNVKSTAGLIYTDVKTEFENAKDKATELIDSLRSTVVETFRNLSNDINDKMGTIKTNVTNRIDEMSTTAVAKIFFMGANMVSTLYGFAGDMVSAGAAIVQGVIDGIAGMAQPLIDAWNAVISAIPGGFADKFIVNSPSKLMMKLARSIPEGMALGIEDGAPLVEKAMNRVNAVASSTDFGSASLGFGGSGGNTVQPIVVVQSLNPGDFQKISDDSTTGAEFARNFGSELGLFTGNI